jgi:hypothetical protein
MSETKVVTGAGHFDVMYFGMDSRIAEDIYKPYSEFGVKAHYEALKEAIQKLPSDKIPSYIIVVDRATLKPKVFVNQKEVRLRPGELEQKMEKYKKYFKDKTYDDAVRVIKSENTSNFYTERPLTER